MNDGKVTIETLLDQRGLKEGIEELKKKLKDLAKDTQGTTNQMNNHFNGLGAKLKSFGSSVVAGAKQVAGAVVKGTAVAVTASSTAIAGLTVQATKSYAKYEQLVGGVDTLFKDASQKVQVYASQAYKTAQISGNQYMEQVTGFSASLLQSLGGDTQKAADYANRAVIDMSDNANKMGTSIESIQWAYQGFAKQNYTMLDNLKLGYGGTKEEMKRLITDASKMTEIQKELNVTVKDGDLSFGNIVNAISVMQKSLGIAGTSAKEAATTIEGSVNMMKASWDNLVTGLGSDDANLQELINQFVESVDTVGDNIFPRIEIILNGVGTLIETMLPKIVERIPKIVIGILPKLIVAGVNMVGAIIQGFATAIPELANTILKGFDNSSLSLAGTVSQFIQKIASALDDAIPQLFKFGQSLSGNIGTIVSQVISGLKAGFESSSTLLMTSGFTLINNLIGGILLGIPQLLELGLTLLNSLASGFVNSIPTVLPQLLQIIQDFATSLANSAPTLIQKGFELLSNLVKGITNAIPILIAYVPTIITTFANIINDNFPTILAKGFEIIVQLIAGLIKAIPTLIANIPQIIKAIVSVFLAYNWLNLGASLITGIGNGIKSMASNVGGHAKNILKSITNVFNNGIKGITDIGKNMIKGLWNGISSVKDWILSKISGFCSGILRGIKGFFGIHSPSRVMKNEVGKFLSMGIVEGFMEDDPMSQIETSLLNGVNSLQHIMNMDISNGLGDLAIQGFKFNQEININQPIASVDEMSRELRLHQMYQMEG
jgi:phage-related protein